MQDRRLVCVIALLAVLLAVPLASAASTFALAARFDVGALMQFQGTIDARAHVLGAVYGVENATDRAGLELKIDAGRIRVINFPYVTAVGPAQWTVTEPAPQEQRLNRTTQGTLTLTSPKPKGSFMLLPLHNDGTLDMPLEGSRNLSISPSATRQPFQRPDGIGTYSGAPRPLAVSKPAGVFIEAAGAGTQLRGPLLAVLYGGTFRLNEGGGTNEDIVTGERLNETRSVADPSGTTRSSWYDRVAIVVEADAAHATLTRQGGNPWVVALQDVAGHWTGDLTFADTAGDVQVEGRPIASRDYLFQAVGDFEAQADYSKPRADWSLQGPATFVGVNGETIVGVRPGRGFPPTAAAAAGLGILVLIYAAVSWIRRGAVYVAVRAFEFKLFTWAPFAARLDLAKVLEHPVRKGIMDMLSGQHAMRNLAELRRDVATAFGISTMAAYFHLRTLWIANHLTVVRMRGQHYIGPNSGGMGPKEQRVAAALLQNPLGLAIAEQVCRNPGVSQKDLIAGVQGKTPREGGELVSKWAILRLLRKFEQVEIEPTHLVQAFGHSLNPAAAKDKVEPVKVGLVVRRVDEKDSRVLRYEPTDVLYEVLRAFVERRSDLGAALTDLTHIRVQRRKPTPSPTT